MTEKPDPREPRRHVLARDFLVQVSTDAWKRFTATSLVKQILAGCLLIGCIICALFIRLPGLEHMRAWSQSAGIWFPVFFGLLYITATQFPIPRTLFTLSAGILFGPLLGSFFAMGCTVISAALSFTFVRRLFGHWMTPHLSHPAVAGITRRLRARGWLAVTALRMIAAVPFSLLNYTAALSPIPLRFFLLATAVGSAPGTIATVLLGDAVTVGGNPAVVAVTVCLFLIGSAGLILDTKMPVRIVEETMPERHSSTSVKPEG